MSSSSLSRDHPEAQPLQSIEQYQDALSPPQSQLTQITAEFENEMEEGLESHEADLPMIPTCVAALPDGHETGECFGIHISGSEVKVICAKLANTCHAVDRIQLKKAQISDRRCSAESLFACVADMILLFSQSIGRDLSFRTDIMPVGLAFSFPCVHNSLQNGKLLKWTKGIAIEGGVGEDPASLLNNAFKAKGIPGTFASAVQCCWQGLRAIVQAFVNDSVADICAVRYLFDGDAETGIGLDTGSNASYVEDLDKIGKLGGTCPLEEWDPSMLINTEWPGFCSAACPILREDKELDDASQAPGEQPFEKLTSFLYLGELARRVLLRVAEVECWPRGGDCVSDSCSNQFATEQLMMATEDCSDELSVVANLMESLLGSRSHRFSHHMRTQAKEICYLIVARSAKLVASALIAITKHRGASLHHGESPSDMAIEGRLFNQYSVYRRLLRTALHRASDAQGTSKVRLIDVEDGAVFGAATLACAAHNQKEQAENPLQESDT